MAAIRIILVAGIVLLLAPVSCPAAEHGAAEEAAPEHGDSAEKPAGEAAADHADSAAKPEGEAAPEHGEGGEKTEAAAEGEAAPPSLPILTPEEAAKQPYGLVRTLQSVQDQVAQGSATAVEFQKRYVAQLNSDLRQVPGEVWDDPRNARAAVAFVLSGGDPHVINDLLARTPRPPVDARLLKGALAFGEGRAQDAIQFFEDIDVRSIEPGLAGIVALIHGTLIAKNEPKKAIALFDEARLASPGTLIEESALRQEILLVARDGNFDLFDKLSSQYSRRFGKSIYARNFRRQFFAGVARQDFQGTSEWISRTEAELMKVPQSERGSAYLSIAQEATLAGNISISGFAAGKAAELAADGSAEAQRARLYQGAAQLVTDDYDKGLAALSNVATQKLRPAEKQIHEAALSLAAQIRKWPEPPQESKEPPSPGVARAQGLISNVDTLLAGGGQ